MSQTYILPRHSQVKPIVFEEYFGLGEDESASPFLTPQSRAWAINLTLKSSLLAAGLLVLSFAFSFSSILSPFSPLLLVFVYFLAGIPSLIESIEDLATFDINIDVLMTLAAFSSVLIGSSMEGGLLLVLFALSGSIEDAVTAKAKNSINQLHKLAPSKAYVLESSGRLIERAIQDINVGTLILVRSGEIVPLDGIVKEGISSVTLVHLTGESLPVTKKIADPVPAGARNMEGTLTLEVTHTSADSTLARIIQLVTQAQEARPQLQRWFDTLSRSYALTIIGLAALFAFSFPFLLQLPFLGREGSLYRALAFLIAASPCALILAIPIAYLSAVSSCARRGILLKGGVTLDALAQCSIVAFDKTGTLTTGQLSYLGFQTITHQNSLNPLEIAYALERNVVHPIAKALIDYAATQQIAILPLENFKSIPGYGVEALVSTTSGQILCFMGHPEYILNKISVQEQQQLQLAIEKSTSQGALIAVLLAGSGLFLFTFQDTIRPQMQETIQNLKQLDLRLLMLTGDHEASARRVAQTLDIDEFYANLKPEHKLEHVTRLAVTKGLAMVGDGVNDAPALARATAGISMGKVGSGTAIEAADVVLLQDNLERLGWLFNKARHTQTIVKQNLFIATAAIAIAALPALAGLVPLWLAVIMHEGGTVIVGLNGLRLLR